MVKGKCHTNLDDYKNETWPTVFYNPKIGDRVASATGKVLIIVSIEHCSMFDANSNEIPLLEIELWKK